MPILPSSPLGFLRSRLSARTDSEHEQATLRIIIVSVVFVWMALSYHPSNDDAQNLAALLLRGLAADLIFALAIFAAICISPAANVPRRLAGSLADNSTATFVMFMTGQAGFAMLGVYLFVAFGNGFRYGRRYLFISQALALLGFASVLLFHDYWAPLQTAGWSLFIALLVLPLYVSTLLRRIHEAQRRAEEANLAKTSFLANMSHEMRTPLNGIVGVADLIRATPLNEQQAELVQLLSHSTLLLRSLVDDVLDISKIEAGRVGIETCDFDLHATINGVVHLLRPHAEAKGLALKAMVDPAIDYTVRGDQHHLRQVLLNLLSNAVKFTHRGEINANVFLISETESVMRLRFEVRDTGIGIAPEAQGRIFEAFVQADDSTTRRFGGTGLGTTIAKQLVELMGGSIGVRSTVGKGSEFWFELPLQKIANAGSDSLKASCTVGLVVAPPDAETRVTKAVEGVVGAAEMVRPERGVARHLQALLDKGVDVPAVVVAGNVEEAVEVLAEVRAARPSACMALIYMAADAAAARQEPRLGRIQGLQIVGVDTPARHLRNAIHAGTTRDLGASAEVIDLASVLQQQRRPTRILVAEDNPTNLAILRQLLESAGHTVFAARDGEQALDIYESGEAELAILDFNMPERNGVEVVSAIRAMETPGIHLPVIILSAAVTVEARERARQGGADEFVAKPFNAASLLQTVDRIARRFPVTGSTLAQKQVSQPAVTSAEKLPLLDLDRFAEVERIATSPDFLNQLLLGFQGDVNTLLSKLDAAVSAGGVDTVRDILHSIKGAAVGIGASRLAAQCKSMETNAESGQLASILGAAPALRHCFEATVSVLIDRRSKRGRVSPKLDQRADMLRGVE